MTAASKAVSQDVSKPAVRIRDITTSLQRQMARPGGIDIEAAVAAAEQGLEGRREETLRVIQDKVQALAAFCAETFVQISDHLYGHGSPSGFWRPQVMRVSPKRNSPSPPKN